MLITQTEYEEREGQRIVINGRVAHEIDINPGWSASWLMWVTYDDEGWDTVVGGDRVKEVKLVNLDDVDWHIDD